MQSKKSYLSKNLILLWQGHFISSIGTVIYSIALGFWVLAETGSATLMGIVSASVVLPKLVISPIAGVIVDESNKKWILVSMDIISGLVVCTVAYLAITGVLKFWHAVIAGVVLGSSESFFRPAVQSIIPKIVPKELLSKANAAYSTAFSASNIIGRFLAGILYRVLGAPLLFLINGLSYLFSACSELFFSSFPGNSEQQEAGEKFFQKMKTGVRQIALVTGLLEIFIIIAFLNFFGFAVVTLYVPFFAQNSVLGVVNYGLVMGVSTAGTLFGQFIFSKITMEPSRRHLYFCFAGVISNLFIIAFPFSQNTIILMALIFLSGVTSAPINIALVTAMQISIPSRFTGRIFSLVGMISGFLVPLAMVVSGALAECFDVKWLISLCAFVLTLLFLFTVFSRKVKTILSRDK